MTTAKPLARYSATNGALASSFATAELHHLMGHDQRGSQWFRWEPHIHAPGTIFNDQFGADSWEAYLSALEAVTPALKAIGIADYYGISTYQRVLADKQQNRLPDCDLIFPNIEMRLGIGTTRGNFVNIHLLVDPSDPDHVDQITTMLSRLTFRVGDQDYGCTAPQLTRLGRRLNSALTDDRAALAYGSQQYKVSIEELRSRSKLGCVSKQFS
ncbi:hypothetical protein [Mesorhizobium sp. M0227]|uniref:hypothetical protein n=1 Tax=Mesorhizobium sp. M0227 TaxID=2956922 RepID=UPI00333D430B